LYVPFSNFEKKLHDISTSIIFSAVGQGKGQLKRGGEKFFKMGLVKISKF
jgi:hypothetical protein